MQNPTKVSLPGGPGWGTPTGGAGVEGLVGRGPQGRAGQGSAGAWAQSSVQGQGRGQGQGQRRLWFLVKIKLEADILHISSWHP